MLNPGATYGVYKFKAQWSHDTRTDRKIRSQNFYGSCEPLFIFLFLFLIKNFSSLPRALIFYFK